MTTRKQGTGFASPMAFVQGADAPRPVAPMIAPKPWDHLDPQRTTRHLLTIGEVEKSKLAYLATKLPQSSVNSLLRDGAALLLEKHKDLLDGPT